MRVTDALARVFSTLFHPLLIPSLAIWILFQLNTYIQFSLTGEARRFIILLIFVHTALAPVLSVLILKRFGYISSYLLDEKGERIFPLLLASVMFFLAYFFLRQLSLPGIIYFFIIGSTLLVIITLLISFLWKISIHMVSLGGFTGFFISASLLLQHDLSLLIAGAFMVSGCTGASRIHLKAHSPAQVYAGFLLGLAGMLLLFSYLRG